MLICVSPENTVEVRVSARSSERFERNSKITRYLSETAVLTLTETA